ncbi:SufD family Fe-S cluster assembly protein [Anaerococcus tetradius]|uniref:SufB/sufD domain protein n=1 Tax=Anaerococcus tetradius ATCC 35098 TaxID=525255 RepID=C2CJV2_9FIRM|nr:SufD family Fe-S cluster assembly protein [Anaerococcus tetradius]EEI82249.1 SufB/sufD domain protein [Anaerococcus tetradius ATCC 35098]
MARINEMRMPTWASLGLNYLRESKVKIEKIEDELNPSEKEAGLCEVEKAFEGHKLGISEKIEKENKDFRNSSLDFDVIGKRETEFINLELNKDKNILVSNIDINAQEESQSSFLVSIFDDRSDHIFLNSRIRAKLHANSYVKLVVVTNMSEKATNLNSIGTYLEEGAVLDITYIEVGAGKSLVNIDNILKGAKSKVIQKGIYFKQGKDFLDLLATNEHFGNETDSECMFNGALKDKAEKNFKGIVDLRRGCTKADGKIGDYSMMLSDEVINKSAPILLNEEREVAGKHAASVGRLNKGMLFYIMSRGFSKKQAEAMMLEANFAPAIDEIEDETLRNRIREKVHQMNTRRKL